MSPQNMLEVLQQIEARLPQMLRDPATVWRTLDVDYEPPRVERVWTQAEQFRVSLHRIHPCEKALFHPHPWPSAVHVLSGQYEMEVGFGPGDTPPPIAATTILAQGSRYQMVHRDGWHAVRPLERPSMSLMVSGQPWERQAPGSGLALKPLSNEARESILQFFREAYRA